MKVKRTSLINKFLIFSHRGFGEKTYARYYDTQRLRFVHNQLTGLELGIENGADVLELDLSKTRDGEIILAHGNPLQKYLPYTKQEYLRKYPEALTLQELLDWFYHQDTPILLYLELKSPITMKELQQAMEFYAKKNSVGLHKFYQQIMLYTYNLQAIRNLIAEKEQFNLTTNDLRIFWVSMNSITLSAIDMVSQIGREGCRVYGIEQGTVPWGFKPFVLLLHIPLPPFLQMKKKLQKLKDIVIYARKKNLQFIVGTVADTKIIKLLMEQGVNGIVPNNPLSVYNTGLIKRCDFKNQAKKYYIPSSMKKRLNLV